MYNPLIEMKQILVGLLIIFVWSCKGQNKVLIFTKTDGYRHESIETGVKTITDLGDNNHFEVTHTENSEMFIEENLKQYDLVIFLNTTKDVLNESQQQNFEQFIRNGGSFMGIHSAADTEYDWPWYGKLVGAYFLSHPEKSNAEIIRVDKSHESCKHLPDRWLRYDEWYNYKSISPDIHVLLKLDESTYKGGENGKDHPIAWYHEYEGARSFYTGLGHTKESYSEPYFRQHLLGGIMYCLKK